MRLGIYSVYDGKCISFYRQVLSANKVFPYYIVLCTLLASFEELRVCKIGIFLRCITPETLKAVKFVMTHYYLLKKSQLESCYLNFS